MCDSIVDDIWIHTFCFLNPLELLVLKRSCKHFHKLTDHRKYRRMSKYWEFQCKRLCKTIEHIKFTTDN